MPEPGAASPLSVRERELRLADPALQRCVVAMETAGSIPEFWRALQGFVNAAFPQHHSATLFLDATERVPGAMTLHSLPSQRTAEWWRARSQLTPTHAFLNDHPGIKLYNLEEIAPDGPQRRRSDFHRHVLRPEGFDKLLGLATWEKGERRSILCVRRAFSQPRFTQAEANVLLDLHPVFERNLRRLEKQEEERVCRRTLQQFINLLPQGVLLVNAKRELVFANPEAFEACAVWNLGPEAARALNSRAVFAIPAPFLEAYEAMLAEHYAAALGSAPASSPPRRRLVHEARPGLQADLSLMVIDDPLLARPYLFVQLLNQELLGTPALPAGERRFAVLSQLTPREREVALLVRDGLGNEEIAARLHKGVGTIKNQLQSIFAKLGINSRARLIALLG